MPHLAKWLAGALRSTQDATMPTSSSVHAVPPSGSAAVSSESIQCWAASARLPRASRCGVFWRKSARQRLSRAMELAQLFLACWSPERARSQRFRQRLDDYTTLAVRVSMARPGSAAERE